MRSEIDVINAKSGQVPFRDQRSRTMRRMHKVGRRWVVLALSALGLFILALTLGKLVLRCDERLYPADVIVVLGYPAQNNGQPSDIMLSRVERGVELYLAGYAPRILVTGSAVRNEFVEAEVMAELAVDLGVSSEDVVVEPRARNTIENARFAAQTMRENGWESAIVVTSPYHIKRGVVFLRDQEVSVVGCATSYSDLSLWEEIKAILYELFNWIVYWVLKVFRRI
jgi:uncharacterized SAM-binding protein YcdF (DUF218 family)